VIPVAEANLSSVSQGGVTVKGVSDWLQVGGLLGVLVGLILLIVELRQNQDLMRAQTRNEITQSEMAHLSSTAGNRDLAEVIVRANNGEPLTPVEQLMFVTRSESAFRLWQNVHYQGRNGMYDADEFSKHLDTMEMVLSRNPGLIAYWCQNSRIYPDAFRTEINGLIPADSCET
jgi:hypothetical protein